MSGTHFFIRSARITALMVLGTVGLAACQDGQLNLPFLDTSGAADTATVAASGPLEERDVEAPDIFDVTDQGLWDGRPSLGGVWVAHPDVADPERVIIRNEATGAFVIGALFRRERENPGPVLQVSSDAAEELGMLAGAPATISVVALRRETAPAALPIATETTGFDTEPTVDPTAPAEVTATALDPIASAPIADVPEAPGAPLGAPLDASSDPLAAAAAAIAAAEAAEPTAPAAAPEPVSSLSRPYIQIGIFSVEANANTAAGQMRDAGLSAIVRAQNSQGRAFWRVIVGPAGSEAARDAALDRVKGLGFTDAYFVTD